SKCGCSGIARSPHSFQKRCGPVVRFGGARAAGWPAGTSPRAHAGPLGWHTALLHAASMLPGNACIAMTSARRNLKLKRRMQSRYLSLLTACGVLEFAPGEGDTHSKPRRALEPFLTHVRRRGKITCYLFSHRGLYCRQVTTYSPPHDA